jgi:hypothetical protein
MYWTGDLNESGMKFLETGVHELDRAIHSVLHKPRNLPIYGIRPDVVDVFEPGRKSFRSGGSDQADPERVLEPRDIIWV